MNQFEKNTTRNALLVSGFFITILSFVYTYITGYQHDYAWYIVFWEQIFSGSNPWSAKGQLYGPGVAFYGLTFNIHVILPKMINTLIWFILFYLLTKKIEDNFLLKFFIFCLMLSPNFWIEYFKFGHFEAYMCLLLYFSLLFFEKNNFILSGVFLAVLVATKFNMVALVPFFCINKNYKNEKIFSKFYNNINLTFLTSFIACLILIYGVSIIIWDKSLIANLFNIVETDSGHISIFRALRGEFSFIPSLYINWLGFNNFNIIANLSLLILIFFLIYTFLIFYLKKISFLQALITISLIVPSFYKSSYAQYFSIYFFLVFIFLSDLKKENFSIIFQKTFILLLPLIFVTFFNFIHAYEYAIFVDQIKIPTFGNDTNYMGFLKIQEWYGYASVLFLFWPIYHLLKNKITY